MKTLASLHFYFESHSENFDTSRDDHLNLAARTSRPLLLLPAVGPGPFERVSTRVGRSPPPLPPHALRSPPAPVGRAAAAGATPRAGVRIEPCAASLSAGSFVLHLIKRELARPAPPSHSLRTMGPTILILMSLQPLHVVMSVVMYYMKAL